MTEQSGNDSKHKKGAVKNVKVFFGNTLMNTARVKKLVREKADSIEENLKMQKAYPIYVSNLLEVVTRKVASEARFKFEQAGLSNVTLTSQTIYNILNESKTFSRLSVDIPFVRERKKKRATIVKKRRGIIPSNSRE